MLYNIDAFFEFNYRTNTLPTHYAIDCTFKPVWCRLNNTALRNSNHGDLQLFPAQPAGCLIDYVTLSEGGDDLCMWTTLHVLLRWKM